MTEDEIKAAAEALDEAVSKQGDLQACAIAVLKSVGYGDHSKLDRQIEFAAGGRVNSHALFDMRYWQGYLAALEWVRRGMTS